MKLSCSIIADGMQSSVFWDIIVKIHSFNIATTKNTLISYFDNKVSPSNGENTFATITYQGVNPYANIIHRNIIITNGSDLFIDRNLTDYNNLQKIWILNNVNQEASFINFSVELVDKFGNTLISNNQIKIVTIRSVDSLKLSKNSNNDGSKSNEVQKKHTYSIKQELYPVLAVGNFSYALEQGSPAVLITSSLPILIKITESAQIGNLINIIVKDSISNKTDCLTLTVTEAYPTGFSFSLLNLNGTSFNPAQVETGSSLKSVFSFREDNIETNKYIPSYFIRYNAEFKDHNVFAIDNGDGTLKISDYTKLNYDIPKIIINVSIISNNNQIISSNEIEISIFIPISTISTKIEENKALKIGSSNDLDLKYNVLNGSHVNPLATSYTSSIFTFNTRAIVTEYKVQNGKLEISNHLFVVNKYILRLTFPGVVYEIIFTVDKIEDYIKFGISAGSNFAIDSYLNRDNNGFLVDYSALELESNHTYKIIGSYNNILLDYYNISYSIILRGSYPHNLNGKELQLLSQKYTPNIFFYLDITYKSDFAQETKQVTLKFSVFRRVDDLSIIQPTSSISVTTFDIVPKLNDQYNPIIPSLTTFVPINNEYIILTAQGKLTTKNIDIPARYPVNAVVKFMQRINNNYTYTLLTIKYTLYFEPSFTISTYKTELFLSIVSTQKTYSDKEIFYMINVSDWEKLNYKYLKLKINFHIGTIGNGSAKLFINLGIDGTRRTFDTGELLKDFLTAEQINSCILNTHETIFYIPFSDIIVNANGNTHYKITSFILEYKEILSTLIGGETTLAYTITDKIGV